MLAHAFLVVAALTDRTRHPPPAGVIPLTCDEVEHLLATLLARPAGDLGHRLRWSLWRRQHQAAPGPATTIDKPTDHEAHDLQTEY